MLNIITYQGNANQNQKAVSPLTHKNDYNKKLITTNSGKDIEKLEPSFIHLVRMKDSTVTSENNLAAPQKYKHRIII